MKGDFGPKSSAWNLRIKVFASQQGHTDPWAKASLWAEHSHVNSQERKLPCRRPLEQGQEEGQRGGGTEESGLREAAATRESGRRAPSSEALGVTRE